MSAVTITVRGEHEIRIAPERATVSITVSADGPDRAATVELAMSRAAPVRASIIAHSDAGAIEDWSSTDLRISTDRRWNNDGEPGPALHRASIDFRTTFADANGLSEWVNEVAALEGLDLGWVDWRLTASTHAEVERSVAAAAVAVAVERAQAYASALGLVTVTPIEIADTELLTGEQSSVPAFGARMSAVAAAGAAPGMTYEPEDITVSASVEARFTAR